MTKSEFLKRLKRELEQELDARTVQEQIRYYDSYITEEIGKGNREEDVVDLLGDPWAIARNILDSPGGREWEQKQEKRMPDGPGENPGTQGSRSGISWWKAALVLVIAGILVFRGLALLFALVRVFLPILVPVVLLLYLKKKWDGRK